MSTLSEPPGGRWVSTDDSLGWTHRLPAKQEFREAPLFRGRGPVSSPGLANDRG